MSDTKRLTKRKGSGNRVTPSPKKSTARSSDSDQESFKQDYAVNTPKSEYIMYHMGTDGSNSNRNILQQLPSAHKAAGRWISYVRKKRKLDETKMSSVLETLLHKDDKGATGIIGKGLDEIDAAFVQGEASKKSHTASNRALIQYFAKLSGTSSSDEELDLDFIEGLIQQGANINCTDKYGQTVLHEVARIWHVDVCKFMLENGADVNQADRYGRTALHVAAAVDYPEMCQFLIDNGAQKEIRTHGESQTPLFYAARNDAIKALQVLLKNDCEFKEVKDYRERTPLFLAAELDRSETARLLLENEAPVGVVDDSGQPALTFMIHKMGPVAHEALNQLHTKDRANRKQFIYLNLLELNKMDYGTQSHAQTPLEALVGTKNFDLIQHPVVMRLINVKWEQFGRRGALLYLVLNMIFITLWTITALNDQWYMKCTYDLPNESWKIVIYVCAVALTLYQIIDEIKEFALSQRHHDKWRLFRKQQLEKDLSYCHPKWPEEATYIKNEIENLKKTKSHYSSDFWNIFDWICYCLLLASTISHIIDVLMESRAMAQWHNRIMAVNIIFVWIRTLKYLRCFAFIGPFIVMLGHVVKDMFRWATLYFIFFIPFGCAFWMTFGGDVEAEVIDNTTETCIAENLRLSKLSNIGGMVLADELFMTVFRLTVVDGYDLDGMLVRDKIMTYILLVFWLWIAAIVFLNLFIALLSDTFQRVYDNANANAIMQKAIMVLSIEDSLLKSKKESYRNFIESMCSPEVTYYDDDAEVSEDLKKVTIQIKEKVDQMAELWELKFGTTLTTNEGYKHYPDDEAVDQKMPETKTPYTLHQPDTEPSNLTSNFVTTSKLEAEINILRSELHKATRHRKDFEKKCLNELQALKSLLLGGMGVPAPPSFPATFSERTTTRRRLAGNPSLSQIDIVTVQMPSDSVFQPTSNASYSNKNSMDLRGDSAA